MAKDYFRYEITNNIMKGINGADTIAECREIIKELEENDKKCNTYIENSYHVFRLNKTTGDRLTQVF